MGYNRSGTQRCMCKVVNIVNMLSRINHIQVAAVSVCVISTGFWRGIYEFGDATLYV